MPRNETVTVRFSTKEVDVLKRYAIQKGMSRSKYIWGIVTGYWNEGENNVRGEVE